jgi:hypothetical protein
MVALSFIRDFYRESRKKPAGGLLLGRSARSDMGLASGLGHVTMRWPAEQKERE